MSSLEPETEGGCLATFWRTIGGSGPTVEVEAGVRRYWMSLAGTLRRLNLRRDPIRDLRIETTSGPVVLSEGDGDPAPQPSALLTCAAKSVEELASAEVLDPPRVRRVDGVEDRLRHIASIYPPWRKEQRADRARSDFGGLAFAHAKVARDGLEWAMFLRHGSPHSVLSARYGLAVAAELLLGTDPQQRAAVDEGIDSLLHPIAMSEHFPAAIRSLARRLAAKRVDREIAIELLEPLDEKSAPSVPAAKAGSDSEAAQVPAAGGASPTLQLPPKTRELWKLYARERRRLTLDDIMSELRIGRKTAVEARKTLFRLEILRKLPGGVIEVRPVDEPARSTKPELK